MGRGPGRVRQRQLAEGELDTIRARSLDASRKLREKGAWFGGVEPFGHRFAERKEGGKRLVQDPVYATLLRSLYMRVVDGTPINRLTKELNKQGTLTWRDHLRVGSGNPSRNTLWSSKAIEQALMNPRTAGYLLHEGEVVEGGDGEPVFIAEDPILSVSEWERVVRKLSATKVPRVKSPRLPTLLTGVARCGVDGGSLYVKRNTVKRTYKDTPDVYSSYTCRHAYSGAVQECRTAADREALERAVERSLNVCFADNEIYEKGTTSKPGLKVELQRVSARFEKLEHDFVAGRYDESGQADSYHRMHEMLAKKRAAPKAQIDEISDVEFVGTGKTFKELWGAKDLDERRAFLLEHGVRVLVWKSKRGLKDPHVKIEIPDAPDMHKSVGVRRDLPVKVFIVDVNMPDPWQGVTVDEVAGMVIGADIDRRP